MNLTPLSPQADTIHLPHIERYLSVDAAYSVAMHELSHWTGHSTRLARDLTGAFGSESYAKEEVIAEVSSHLMGVELQIGHSPDQHAAYIKHWLRIAQQDPSFLYTAGAAAEKILDFVGVERFAYEPMVKQEQEHRQDLDRKKLVELFEALPILQDFSHKQLNFGVAKTQNFELT